MHNYADEWFCLSYGNASSLINFLLAQLLLKAMSSLSLHAASGKLPGLPQRYANPFRDLYHLALPVSRGRFSSLVICKCSPFVFIICFVLKICSFAEPSLHFLRIESRNNARKESAKIRNRRMQRKVCLFATHLKFMTKCIVAFTLTFIVG